jgi:hypothetical protein
MTSMATSTSSLSASGADRKTTSLMSNAAPLTRALRASPAARALRAGLVVAVLGGFAFSARPARAADPSVSDCLMAAETSLKLRAEHKLRLTRTQLLVCSAASCPAEVRQECNRRIDEVNAASPTIVLAVKDRAGSDLSAVRVSVDGQVVAEHLDGSALSIDPGPHEFTFEASGAPTLTETIILHEGEKDRRETVALAVGAAPQPSTAGPGSSSGAAGESATSGAGKAQRIVGLVAGGVGVVGLGLGAVFGVLASSSWKTAQSECPDHTGCSPQAMNDRSHAVTDATASTVGFIAGGALLAGGLTLFLTAPKGDSPRAGFEARPGGFAVSGEF